MLSHRKSCKSHNTLVVAIGRGLERVVDLSLRYEEFIIKVSGGGRVGG